MAEYLIGPAAPVGQMFGKEGGNGRVGRDRSRFDPVAEERPHAGSVAGDAQGPDLSFIACRQVSIFGRVVQDTPGNREDLSVSGVTKPLVHVRPEVVEIRARPKGVEPLPNYIDTDFTSVVHRFGR